MELPMLDEEEFAVIAKLYAQSMSRAKEFRMENRASLSDTTHRVVIPTYA
jgi:hypothetical protein